jgi:hypothetical protein
MSKDLVKTTWYTKEEFDGIKKSFVPLIQAMVKGEQIAETDKQTIRGLEFRTRHGAIRRQRNKLRASAAVILEQERQLLDDGELDDCYLSDIYQQCTATCRAVALQRGLKDEATIKEYTQPSAPIASDSTTEEEEPESPGFRRKPVARTSSMSRAMAKLFKQVRPPSKSSPKPLLDDHALLDSERVESLDNDNNAVHQATVSQAA